MSLIINLNIFLCRTWVLCASGGDRGLQVQVAVRVQAAGRLGVGAGVRYDAASLVRISCIARLALAHLITVPQSSHLEYLRVMFFININWIRSLGQKRDNFEFFIAHLLIVVLRDEIKPLNESSHSNQFKTMKRIFDYTSKAVTASGLPIHTEQGE